MSDFNQIQLKTTRISNIPLEKYEKNFTFIVNGEQFQTNRIIADLISPQVCKFHINDPDRFFYDRH